MKKTIFLLVMMTCLPPPMHSLAQNHEYDILAPNPPRQPLPALGVPLEHLPPQQRIKAFVIISEFSPKVYELRQRIINKKSELEDLNFDKKTSPDTLSRLGWDLQVLRDELRSVLTHADQRMRLEVGIPLGTPTSRGCSMDFEQTPCK